MKELIVEQRDMLHTLLQTLRKADATAWSRMAYLSQQPQASAGTAASVSTASIPSIGSDTTATLQADATTMTSGSRPVTTDPYAAHDGYQNYARLWYPDPAKKHRQDDDDAQGFAPSKARGLPLEHKSSSATLTQPAAPSRTESEDSRRSTVPFSRDSTVYIRRRRNSMSQQASHAKEPTASELSPLSPRQQEELREYARLTMDMIALTNNVESYNLKPRTRFVAHDGILRLHYDGNQRLRSRYGVHRIMPLFAQYVDIADYWAEEHALGQGESSDMSRTESRKRHRDRSRGRRYSKPPNRLRETVTSVVGGLAAASVAHVYEKRRATDEELSFVDNDQSSGGPPERFKLGTSLRKRRASESSLDYQQDPSQAEQRESMTELGNPKLAIDQKEEEEFQQKVKERFIKAGRLYLYPRCCRAQTNLRPGYSPDYVEDIRGEKQLTRHSSTSRRAQNQLTIEADRPTYIRSQVRHLDPQTLEAYDLSWEYDPSDDQYILIKDYISHEFQEELFEHTRKIRQERLVITGGYIKETVTTLKPRKTTDEIFLVRRKSNSKSKDPTRSAWMFDSDNGPQPIETTNQQDRHSNTPRSTRTTTPGISLSTPHVSPMSPNYSPTSPSFLPTSPSFSPTIPEFECEVIGDLVVEKDETGEVAQTSDDEQEDDDLDLMIKKFLGAFTTLTTEELQELDNIDSEE